MSGHIDTERILDAFLAPEHDRLADRVLEASLADIARTPQRRALRVPWRFPRMSNLSRAAAGIAAVAIIAVGVLAFNLRSPGAGSASPTSGLSPSPTATPVSTRTPVPTDVAPDDIAAWTTYTSTVYPRLVVGHPADWTVGARATRAWQTGDSFPPEGSSYAEAFVSPGAGEAQVALLVWEMRVDAPPDSFLSLKPWAQAFCGDVLALSSCDSFTDQAVPMCHLVGDECDTGNGAILVPTAGAQYAFFRTWQSELFDSSTIRVVVIAREDDFPGAAQYGGSVALLKSVLSTMNVWPPGQEPTK